MQNNNESREEPTLGLTSRSLVSKLIIIQTKVLHLPIWKMKTNSKNNPKSLAQWAKEITLDQKKQQKIKGGAYPWIDKP